MKKSPPPGPGETQLSPEMIKKIREVSLKSTYAFGKFVCGFYDMEADLHGRMARWVEKGTRLKLGQAPRGFLKTSVWNHADKLRRGTANPNMRVLLCNETAENSSHWIGVLQRIVLSPYYRALFPEVIPDIGRVKWNSSQLELKRERHWPEATIEAIGVGGASTSRHYDIIVNDDLVGKEARESPSVMQKAIDQRKLCWSLMVDASKSEIHDFGTRWHPVDLIDWIVKNVKDVDALSVDLRDPVTGLPAWAKRYPEEVIQQIRVEQGPEMFALQYLNQAIGGGASTLDPNDLRYWTETVDAEEKRIFVLESPQGARVVRHEDCFFFQIIDAGLTPESPDARTGNLVAALTPPTDTEPFDIVIVEAKATRSLPNDVVAEAHQSYVRWDPLFAAIEVFGGHAAFFYWISSTYPDMRLRKLPTDTSRNAKANRILGFWGVYPKQGRVYVHRHMHTDLLDELAAYPNGRTVDLLDCGGYLPKVWAPPNPVKAKRRRPPGVTDFDISDAPPEDFIGPGGAEGRSEITGYAWLLPLIYFTCFQFLPTLM